MVALEKETFEKFGYYPRDLKQKSNKKIVAVCDDCGKIRFVKKSDYRALCLSCKQKGTKSPLWKGGQVQRICEICGTGFPLFPSQIKRGRGRFCSPQCEGKWRSENFRGENSPSWKGGASFEPYCHKFNDDFKEYIREKFGRTCFLCDKTEEENGKHLSIHHVNGNKNCGCDDDETCQFVPLCMGCHGKVHSKKLDWEAKIRAMMKNTLNGW